MESATTAGVHPGRNADAVSVFHLEVPGVPWRAVVLAIADGSGWPIRGDVASAVGVAGIEQGLTDRFRQLNARTPAWQDQVAEALVTAFAHAHHRIRALREPGPEPAIGVGLTLALLLGDWLCVAHAGDGRVYRRSRGELEQLTADQGGGSSTGIGPNRRLGLPTQQPPAVRFFQLTAGDQILVCSKGLSHQLDGAVLAHLMSASSPLAQLARHLITVAAARRGPDDASLCLTRVRRLPARLPASARMDFEQAAETATLPRYASRTGLPWDARQVVAALGTVVLVGGLLLGWRVWPPLSAPVGARQAPEEQRPTNGVGALGSARVDVPDEASTPALTPDTTPEPPAVAAPPEAPRPQPKPVRAPDPRAARDSLQAIRRAAAITSQRAAAERARRDSVILEERLTEERLQRLRDQARATPPPPTKPDPQVKAEQERRAAEQRRAEEEAATAAAKAAAAAKAETVKLEAGNSALDTWVNALVSAVNTGKESAPVLTPGPTSFVAFVDKYHPRLTDARILQRTVDSVTARATVEWVARWKSTFGTATSQRMTAVVTLVPLGDTWQVTGWRITEGAK